MSKLSFELKRNFMDNYFNSATYISLLLFLLFGLNFERIISVTYL